MNAQKPGGLQAAGQRPLSLGSVSYLNAKPLIWGIERDAAVELLLDVPSRLLAGLCAEQNRFDVALLPVIDYQRLAGLRIVPAGGIGCDGPTLTVRIFSRVPIERIGRLACDTDSHTSVALARVVLAERYGARPEFVNLVASCDRVASCQLPVASGNSWQLATGNWQLNSEALLLIGDKVVCEEPAGFEHQLDLGQAWKELTGLPFVFAVWMARDGVELGELPVRLEEARREGLRHVEEIIAEHAIPRGWPAEVARRYLTSYLKYDVGPRQLHAIREFHRLAAKHGAIEGELAELRLYSGRHGTGK